MNGLLNDLIEKFKLAEGKIYPLEEAKTLYILRALKVNSFNRTHTAKQLRISIKALRSWISKMRTKGIDIP